MGQNGAGKSTLINVLTGVHAHDAGEIRVGGAPVHSPRRAKPRRPASRRSTRK